MQRIFKLLGPGLLYAAAAIGVSHLVQSTRAGADFGFQLLWVVIIANILKYPFFKIGPKYTAVTGKSLLHGWQQNGPYAIKLFFILTIFTMFTVQAAVTLVTAGISLHLFNLDFSVSMMSAFLLLVSVIILLIGKFNVLDNLIKIVVIILTVATLIAVALALTENNSYTTPAVPFNFDNKIHIFFLIALIGWMPAPMDVPIWHSLWSVAKNNENEGNKTTLKDSMLDFNIGYIGTAILACCFLTLGALVMYRSGQIFSGSALTFSTQLIGMYTSILGEWAFIFIAVASFATMFSTTLTCLDAFPRILSEAYKIERKTERNTYTQWLLVTGAGSLLILFLFISDMKVMVDFTTTLSFVVSPIYAYLTYKAMNSKYISEEHHTKGVEKYIAFVGLTFFTIFTIYFIWLKFLS